MANGHLTSLTLMVTTMITVYPQVAPPHQKVEEVGLSDDGDDGDDVDNSGHLGDRVVGGMT